MPRGDKEEFATKKRQGRGNGESRWWERNSRPRDSFTKTQK